MKLQRERVLEVLEPTLIAYRLSGYKITHCDTWRGYSFMIDTGHISDIAIEIQVVNDKFAIRGYFDGYTLYKSSSKCYEGLPKRFVNAMKAMSL